MDTSDFSNVNDVLEDPNGVKSKMICFLKSMAKKSPVYKTKFSLGMFDKENEKNEEFGETKKNYEDIDASTDKDVANLEVEKKKDNVVESEDSAMDAMKMKIEKQIVFKPKKQDEDIVCIPTIG